MNELNSLGDEPEERVREKERKEGEEERCQDRKGEKSFRGEDDEERREKNEEVVEEVREEEEKARSLSFGEKV